MSKTIETMWKEGFMQESELSAPKITDLYNQKSQHITDKVKNMYRANVKYLIIGTPIGWAFLAAFGLPFLGLYVAMLLGYIIIEGKKQMARFDAISQGQNCYQYLKAVNQSFKDMSEHFIAIYQKFYPLLFAGIFVRFLFSDNCAELSTFLVRQFDHIPTLFNIHMAIYIGGALLTIFFYLVGGIIGKFDIDLIYKSIASKLDDLQQDMEALR